MATEGAPGAPATGEAARKGKGKSSPGAWVKKHKVETGAAAVGAVALLAIIKRKSSKTPATSSTAAASGQPAGTYAGSSLPVTYPSTPATDWGPQLDSLQNEITAIEAQMGNPSTAVGAGVPVGGAPVTTGPGTGGGPAPSSAPAPASPGGGLAVQEVNGTPFDVLGYLTGPDQYTGHEVGGGAPVWFIRPGAAPETNISPAALHSLPQGTELLTPQQFEGQISPNVDTRAL